MVLDDAVFAAAIAAIDEGDADALRKLLDDHPALVRARRAVNEHGYFTDPYLLWHVANNPIRQERMAPNIVELTRLIIDAAQRESVSSLPAQLDYTVALVASGRVPRECDVQLALIDALVDAGGSPDALVAALGHHETAAAQHLVERGAGVTLMAAVCLDRRADVARLLRDATRDDLAAAIAGAAIYGHAWALATLLDHGAEPNGFCPDGLHAHSTPLHQAVVSGSLDAVRVLVEAGADLSVRDRGFDSTPLGWAEYGEHAEIAQYLRAAGSS